MKKGFIFSVCFLLIFLLNPLIESTAESCEEGGPDIESNKSGPVSIQQIPNMFLPYTTRSVGSWPEAVAIGDVNGDGRNDVVMTTSYYFDPDNDYKLFVFLQNTSGQLETPAKYDAGNGYSVDIGDLNNDGRNDVVVTRSNGIGVFIQNSTGTLNPVVLYSTTNVPDRVRIGDFNNDGLADVVTIGGGYDVNVFLQNTSGTLNAPDNYTVIHGGFDDLDVGDINNDGLADIVVMSGGGSANNFGVLYQNVGGSFDSVIYYDLGGDELTKGIAVGDVNRDSLRDIVVTYGGNRPSSYIGVFLQNAAGSFDRPTSYESYDIPEPIIIGRVNRDLRQDVIVTHGGWAKMGVYLQESNGSLRDEELYDIPNSDHYNPHGLAIGDINSDKKNDVVIAYYEGMAILYGTISLVCTLTIEAGEGGTTDPPSGTYTYEPETSVTIRAIPEAPYSFLRWGGSVSGTDNPITITMNSDMNIRAIFTRPYTLTISAGDNGTTDPPPGNYTYYSGSQAKIMPLPNSGCTFSHWTGDIFPVQERDNPLFVDINSNKSISAVFHKEKGTCFIATSAYSSPYHPHVKILQDFKDGYLMPSKFGRMLVNFYYRYSPSVAELIAKHRPLKALVRIGLMPMIAFSYSMVHFGPVFTAVVLAFIFVLPILLISFIRKRMIRVNVKR